MQSDRETMQMALDALTIFREWEMGQDYNSNRETVIARAFKAEEALSAALSQGEQDTECPYCAGVGCVACDARCLPQGEQEPYGYLWFTRYMEHRFTHRIPEENERIGDVKPVYTAPPQRPWQGLTDEDIRAVWIKAIDHSGGDVITALITVLPREIDAKLKEKNT